MYTRALAHEHISCARNDETRLEILHGVPIWNSYIVCVCVVCVYLQFFFIHPGISLLVPRHGGRVGILFFCVPVLKTSSVSTRAFDGRTASGGRLQFFFFWAPIVTHYNILLNGYSLVNLFIWWDSNFLFPLPSHRSLRGDRGHSSPVQPRHDVCG